MRIIFNLIFILVFFVFASTVSIAQTTSRIALPDTAVGKVAELFFESLNSGETVKITNFIERNFTEQALKDTATNDQAKFFARLYRQSGGVEPMIISPDSNERFLVVEVKSIRGNNWARMFFVLTDKVPQKLVEIGIFGVRDPQESKRNAWPETKMTEKAALDQVAVRIRAASKADRFSGVVLVAKGDRIVINEAHGFADKGLLVPNRIDTKFNLASMNKMITAISIAQLVEAGKLSLDDTLAKVLPEYPNEEAAGKIRVRHLLSHTSGLGDFFDNPEFRSFRQKYKDPKDYFPLFSSRPLYFAPGERFSYSNAGFVVLGAIVEKISGENYFDYVREHVYKPAGMTNTDSYELTEVVPNLAIGYGRFDDDPMGVDPRRSNIAFLPWKGSPAGGGYSTPPDLLKFAKAFTTDKLVSRQTRENLISAKTVMAGSYRPGSYGFGFVTEEFSRMKTFGHGGGGANSGINCDMKIFADGSFTVIVMGNYDSPAADDMAYEITRLLARI